MPNGAVRSAETVRTSDTDDWSDTVNRMPALRATRTLSLSTLLLLSSGAHTLAQTEPPTSETPRPVIKRDLQHKRAAVGPSLSGIVRWTGPAPEIEQIRMHGDAFCAGLLPDGILRRPAFDTRDGGLGGVLVRVKGIEPSTAAVATEPVVLDQRSCLFEPTVVAVRVGQPLVFRNSDATLQNVHGLATVNAEFNIGMPRKGGEATQTFSQAEVFIPIRDAVHPWKKAYVAVLDSPYFAVSDSDGHFTISGLAAGDYEIEARHPTLGAATERVTVVPEGGVTVEFLFPTGVSKSGGH